MYVIFATLKVIQSNIKYTFILQLYSYYSLCKSGNEVVNLTSYLSMNN